MKFLVICIRPYAEQHDNNTELDNAPPEQHYFTLTSLIPNFFAKERQKQRANGEPLYQYNFFQTIEEAELFLKRCGITPRLDYAIQDGKSLMETKTDHVVFELLDRFDSEKMSLADNIHFYYVLKPEGFVYSSLLKEQDEAKAKVQALENSIEQDTNEQLKAANQALTKINDRIEKLQAAKFQKFVNNKVDKPYIEISVTIDATLFSQHLQDGRTPFTKNWTVTRVKGRFN